MGSGTRVALCIGVVVLGVAGGVFAGPASPTISGATATFNGDQSDGIASGVGFSVPPVWTVRVNSLTDDITPAAGVSGIKMRYQAAGGSNGDWSLVGDGENGGVGGFGGMLDIEPVYIETLGIYLPMLVVRGPSVDFSGGDYSISTSGATAHGISVTSLGGNGGNGGWAAGALGLGPAFGGHGGAGGWGGPASVTSAGDITTNGTSSYGILAESLGGRGGNGGSAGGATYAVGGNGGAGGGGGSVTINSSSHIITQGESSDGIVGQSMGGAGGNGGDGGAIAGEGGGASGSGPGGTVTITNSGAIETQKEDSGGIFAQSVGGFTGSSGGGGGIVGWGGDGNSAGNGGSVTVANSGAITTIGYGSDSVFAQSIGGGGGKAAASGGLVGLGGTGSAGGSGGEVMVRNNGVLVTGNDEARGIVAQSIGGGGGAGGNSGGAFSVGGTGTATGNGGTVTVDNRGTITTGGVTDEGIVTGNGSNAIFAQSLGGGGGITGGSGGNDYGAFMSLGGTGGSGGNGGIVAVTNSGVLDTTGIDASGILAQSIGGGGGNGGQAYDVGMGFNYTAGGDSSLGGYGQQVTVTSEDASIVTRGALSHGIHAVSIGGGGGTGGNVLNVTAGIQMSASYTAGGIGGGGGNGGDATVNSAGQIETYGDNAYGLAAESMGGGGGSGGNTVSWLANLGGLTDELPSFNMIISLGGNGGNGGNGGVVRAGNAGDIDTFGAFGYGVFAQSVGGGGGAGGNSMAGTLAINSMDITVSVGGAGGGAGNGQLVDVDSSGSIETRGDLAYGILAQSIGGGGGAGGSSTALAINLDFPTDLQGLLPSPDASATLSLGGKSGGGGNGGIVDVTNTGTISTQGELAHGILAQSVGGGGGAGGDATSISIDASLNPADYIEYLDFMSADLDFVLGGTGGAGGNGVAVTVRNSGRIDTQGNFAAGILAQSIGGGGGAGGAARSDTYSLIDSDDSSMRLLGGYGGHGTGGAVTVENSSDITTHGGFSHGILAQSVGGGGGFGALSEDDGVSTLNLGGRGVFAQNTGFGVGFAGSIGGSGAAGAVNVTHTGSITTYGEMSHGILAQSVARGAAGPVSVTLASEILAHGANSDGIYAQSLGSTRGNITVNVNGGVVQGGSGSGVGVHIDGGAENTLANSGEISAWSGMAILATGGNDVVNNLGTVTGSVDLGSGVNAFNNKQGGRFNTGSRVDLGDGNTLFNDGTLSPGGLGVIAHTLLDGNLSLLDDGVLEIDVGGFSPGSFDFVEITGALSGWNPDDLGAVEFSFLPDFDLVPVLGPHQTMTLEFLAAGSIGDLAMMSYSYSSCPQGFRYDVFEDGGSLYLRASCTIPAPGALLLTSVGLGLLRLGRRRMRS